MKAPIVFDLDGTLALGKSSLDPEMAGLMARLLGIVMAPSFRAASGPSPKNRCSRRCLATPH
jgi:hypothetical protein